MLFLWIIISFAFGLVYPVPRELFRYMYYAEVNWNTNISLGDIE